MFYFVLFIQRTITAACFFSLFYLSQPTFDAVESPRILCPKKKQHQHTDECRHFVGIDVIIQDLRALSRKANDKIKTESHYVGIFSMCVSISTACIIEVVRVWVCWAVAFSFNSIVKWIYAKTILQNGF